MDKQFYTTKEVADVLRIKPKTLQCYHARHALFRPARQGLWYKEHVSILIKVWAGALSEDEGLAFWQLEKKRMRGL